MSKKRDLINLYNPSQETSKECYLALDSFIEEVFTNNNVSWVKLSIFQDKTRNFVIDEKYNDILSILKMCEASHYDLDLYLDAFVDVIELYAAVLSTVKKGK